MNSQTFTLNENLAKSSHHLISLKLCQLRLKIDSQIDWFLLIPQLPEISEICDLTLAQQKILFEELAGICKIISSQAKFKKMNIATLGNYVSQMHWHIILRQENDRAWPDPIWTFPDANLEQFSLDRLETWKKCFNSLSF